MRRLPRLQLAPRDRPATLVQAWSLAGRPRRWRPGLDDGAAATCVVEAERDATALDVRRALEVHWIFSGTEG